MSTVLLLRTANQGGDRYEDALTTRGYHPISVPVLEAVIIARDELAHKLTLGPAKQDISGVIITSKRAVEAWRGAAQALPAAMKYLCPSSDSEWSSVPFYVVGEATSDALRHLCEEGIAYSPRDIRGGSETGTAERLAEFILEDTPSDGSRRKLLYLTGDKNRDTLPRILESGGVALDSIQVYATQGSSTFPHDLSLVVERVKEERISWGWVVYFAPSVAEFVTPFLCDHFILPTVNSDTDYENSDHRHVLKVAAIGPTTESFLLQNLKLSVATTPRKPNAEDLAEAILECDNAQVQ